MAWRPREEQILEFTVDQSETNVTMFSPISSKSLWLNKSLARVSQELCCGWIWLLCSIWTKFGVWSQTLTAGIEQHLVGIYTPFPGVCLHFLELAQFSYFFSWMFSKQYYPYKSFSHIKPWGERCYVGCFLSSFHPKTGKTGAHGGKWRKAVQVLEEKQEIIPEEEVSWIKGSKQCQIASL